MRSSGDLVAVLQGRGRVVLHWSGGHFKARRSR
jgi:hypothetical protein